MMLGTDIHSHKDNRDNPHPLFDVHLNCFDNTLQNRLPEHQNHVEAYCHAAECGCRGICLLLTIYH